MNARAAKRLYDGKVAAQKLETYVEGQTLDGFLSEEMWRYAVERKAGVLALAMEASVREEPELSGRLPFVERVIGLQECLVLEASEDERRRMWAIVTEEVPALLLAIDAELDAFGLPDEEAPLDPTIELRPVELILGNLDAIAGLCREYQVERLDVFGSATTGAFDLETSDVDFLVTYLPESRPNFGQMLEFEDRLAQLLGRNVDLVEEREFGNPYFRQSVRLSRVQIYSAEGGSLQSMSVSSGESEGRDSSLRSE